MAQVKDRRNNLLAGGLVLCSLIATVIVIVLISGGVEFFGKKKYVVEFSLETGVTGLKRGSAVRLGGRDVGIVQGVQFVASDDDFIRSLHATIAIDESIKLRDGVVAFLETPLLASNSIINIPSIGEGESVLSEGDVIPGRQSPVSFLSQAGYGEEEAQRLPNIMKQMDEFTGRAAEVAGWVQDELQPKVAADYDEWRVQIGNVMDDVETFADGMPGMRTDIEDQMDRLRNAIESAQGMIDENRANVKDAIANAREITEKGNTFMDRLNGEISDRAVAILENGKGALDDARRGINNAVDLLGEQAPNIRRTMANFRLSADQLALTMLEVRRSPWRLLYRPDMREIEYELLYDSARTYASAVSDLRAASESLESLLASDGTRLATGGQTVQSLIERLEDARKTYEQAEQRFLDVLMESE